MKTDRVLVSNGYGQFHMARLAEELHKRSTLIRYVTGAYSSRPNAVVSRLALRFPPIRRLLERTIKVPKIMVDSIWSGEILYQAAQSTRRTGMDGLVDFLLAGALRRYSARARRVIAAIPEPGVYHYRAGFGGSSLDLARDRGWKLVCDHSIVHPRLIKGLVDGSGGSAKSLNRFWTIIEKDIDSAEIIIVNSDFVAETMFAAGIHEDRVRVAYTAVQPTFLAKLDRVSSETSDQRTKVLFAGTAERRKGIDAVINAIGQTSTSEYAWTIAGSWDHDSISRRSELGPNVRATGNLSRDILAKEMANTHVFVFPSKAEGSARVVAEALCAGAFVITTRNSGSIMRDGIDGTLVPVDDPEAIVKALAAYRALSPGLRIGMSDATRAYAQERLSEGVYVNSVVQAYGV